MLMVRFIVMYRKIDSAPKKKREEKEGKGKVRGSSTQSA